MFFFLFQVLTTEVCSICKNSLSCTLTICAHFCICVIMRSLKFYKYMYIIYTRGERENSFGSRQQHFSRNWNSVNKFLFPFPYLKKAATLLWSPRATLYVSQKKILQFSASFIQLKNTKYLGVLSTSVHFQEEQSFFLPALYFCVRVC